MAPCMISRKTIQNTPSQQHPVFSNTGKLWGGFIFFFCIIFFTIRFFSIEKFVFILLSIQINIFFLYVFIYRNVIHRNLSSLLRPDVAVWTFDVWFHAILRTVFFFFLTVNYTFQLYTMLKTLILIHKMLKGYQNILVRYTISFNLDGLKHGFSKHRSNNNKLFQICFKS